ncbi:hypothetical protein V6N13_076177 [Hibiscus sabdariffa]
MAFFFSSCSSAHVATPNFPSPQILQPWKSLDSSPRMGNCQNIGDWKTILHSRCQQRYPSAEETFLVEDNPVFGYRR